MQDVSTVVLIMELRKRIGDRLNDPEPQYDAHLSGLDEDVLVVLLDALDDTQIERA